MSYHRRHAPDIGTCPPLGAQDDLWRAVLSGLDIVCEVMSHPASVPKICNFDRDGIHSFCYIFLACFLWRGSLVEGDTGYSLRKVLTASSSARLKCAEMVRAHAVFSWCFWSSSVLLEGIGSARPSISRIDLGGVVETAAPFVTTSSLGVRDL